MRKILTILLFAFSLTALGNKLYVSTTGNDGAAGTYAAPWATWQKGFSTVLKGDTLYIMGGTYSPVETVYSGYDVGAYAYAHDGNADTLITVLNYPGQIPIMDATNVDGSYVSIGVYLRDCDYWHVKGLVIQNSPGFGMELQSCTNVTVELCVAKYNVESGFRTFFESDDILFLNCDSHHNASQIDPGEPDGFEASNITYREGDLRTVTYRGCRSWENSDDGYDHWSMDGSLIYDGCWAWRNGFNVWNSDHNGDGFKFGQTSLDMSAYYSRKVTNCVSWHNSLYGFTQNMANTKMILYNNTSCMNLGGGFNLWWYDLADTVMNNISCMNIAEEWNGTYLNRITATNSYDSKLPDGPVATSDDFISIDTTGVSGARQPDGSLPSLPFLRLKSTSDLVNAGTNVGISYVDAAPDIGAYESSTTLGDYYIETWGSNTHGNGTIDDPWRTLKHAADTITGIAFVGDTVVVGAGRFIETATSSFSTGIYIYGTGTASIITTSSALTPIISMQSSEGTNGGQSISNITIDGNFTARSAIDCRGRSNVKMHNVTVKNFNDDTYNTVNIAGRLSGSSEPTIYATGIEVSNCTFIDCGSDFAYDANTYFATAALTISGLNGALVINNIVRNPSGDYGYGIRCINGYLRGSKINDNDIQVNLRDEVGKYSYAFAIELWTGTGGVEVMRNTCTGGIDFSGYGWDDRYGYGFALKVCDNTVILPKIPVSIEGGLVFEAGFDGGVIVSGNYVKNFQTGLVFSLRENSLVQGIDGLHIVYNIFDELGQDVAPEVTEYCVGIGFNMVKLQSSVDNSIPYTPSINGLLIANNVFYRGERRVQLYGMNFEARDAVTGMGPNWSNVTVVNNITWNVYTPLKWDYQTINGILIAKNVTYGATNNTRFVSCVVTNDDVEAALTFNPLFVTPIDFNLQPTSQCIDAGEDIGLTKDYTGKTVPFNSIPDIGAYEHGSYEVIPGVTTLGSGTGNNLMVDKNGRIIIIQ